MWASCKSLTELSFLSLALCSPSELLQGSCKSKTKFMQTKYSIILNPKLNFQTIFFLQLSKRDLGSVNFI